MRLVQFLQAFVPAVFMLLACYPATLNAGFIVTLNPSQITDNTNPFNDVWDSGDIDLGEIVQLDPGEMYTADIMLQGGSLLLDDGFFNGVESIHFTVDGEGGAGGGFNNDGIDFMFTILGTGATLTNHPVAGNTDWIPTNGNVDYSQDVDLFNGGTFNVTGIQLKLTNAHATNTWSFDKVSVGLDVDDISIVPEPSSLVLLGMGGLCGLCFHRRRERREYTT